MEINETTVLDDRVFIQISGDEAKDFLQNIVTNDIEKITENTTLFSSSLTPQGKYLYEFFLLKLNEGYLLECVKEHAIEIIKLFNIYKLRSKVNLKDVCEKYENIIITPEKFKELFNTKYLKGFTTKYNDNLIYVDPRNEKLGAKILSKPENTENIIKDLDLKKVDKKKYYMKSFHLGIPQLNLSKLKEKIFGIENNLDELGAIDFKKGCYVGQENTSRIKLRNKLRRRILPIEVLSGKIKEKDIVKYKNNEIGKIMINEPYSFALVKVVEPDLKEFVNKELICGTSKIKILKPDWI